MAKGRKLTTSQSERYLGAFSYTNHSQESANNASEFDEHDVWSMVDDSNEHDGSEWNSRAYVETSYNNNHLPPPRGKAGGLSLAFHDPLNSSSPRIVHQLRAQESVGKSPHARHVASSAPVNVPDWSKIYRVESVESIHDSHDGFINYDSEIVPPHEYLARKSATNSVFEGVGRTLKGRDLSRVRDAVWSQTGFDG